MAERLGSRASLQAAQCFVGSSPGCGHDTAHQATLGQRPTCHGWRDPQRRIYNYVPGGLWGKKGKNKKILKKNVFKKKERKKEIMDIKCPGEGLAPHFLVTLVIAGLMSLIPARL